LRERAGAAALEHLRLYLQSSSQRMDAARFLAGDREIQQFFGAATLEEALTKLPAESSETK
jgi:hypothetical protein